MDSGFSIAVILAVLVVSYFLLRAVKVVRDGHVGVVTRMGGFRRIRAPGLVVIVPVIDRLATVDMRERSRTERLDATTLDDHLVAVQATVVAQVVDARQASSSIATAAFRASISTRSLTDVLVANQAIAAETHRQLEGPMERWGARIRRIDDVVISESG